MPLHSLYETAADSRILEVFMVVTWTYGNKNIAVVLTKAAWLCTVSRRVKGAGHFISSLFDLAAGAVSFWQLLSHALLDR